LSPGLKRPLAVNRRSACARVESINQINKVGGWGNNGHGWGTISITVDPTKLAAGKGVGGSLSVTCATVAS